MESLGIRLKKLRKDKGLTQVELGKLSGVTGVTIGYWEKDLNEPGSKALSKLAHALGTTESYLLYGVSSPELSFVQSNPGTKIPYFSWGDAISFLILEGEKTMGNVDRITTFFDVVEGDFAVSMPDDTMHNPSGSPSIPVGATVILRPGESYKNGSIVAVIVPDPLTNEPSMTIKKLVIDGKLVYLSPLNPRYQSSLLTPECKIVAVAKGVQFNL
ncbi:LexA family transcriptional regulator [Escherichia coli]|nr:LexA family transcriptional regulator [Escherichia coli]